MVTLSEADPYSNIGVIAGRSHRGDINGIKKGRQVVIMTKPGLVPSDQSRQSRRDLNRRLDDRLIMIHDRRQSNTRHRLNGIRLQRNTRPQPNSAQRQVLAVAGIVIKPDRYRASGHPSMVSARFYFPQVFCLIKARVASSRSPLIKLALAKMSDW